MAQLKSGQDRLVACAVFLAITTAFPSEASAYIGPGSGLAALGTLAALVGTVFLGLFGFIWFPVKRMLNKRKTDASAASTPKEK